MRPDKPLELPPDLARLRIIPVEQAAELKGLSLETFERTYPHLIKKIARRLRGCRLGELMDAPLPADLPPLNPKQHRRKPKPKPAPVKRRACAPAEAR